jgi:hypothetical protein
VSGPTIEAGEQDARRGRARRLAIVLALAAAAVYVGFIALQIVRARG